MNIGIVSVWGPTGAGHVSKAYERVLQKEHNVFIYARGGPGGKGDPHWELPNVSWAPFHPCTTGIYSGHFSNWVQKHAINIVIFNEQRHWSGVVLARKLGLIIGAYVDYYTADTVPFFGLYDFLICNTKRHYSVFDWHPQVYYCPWGTDPGTYKPADERLERPITFLISAGWDGAYASAQPWMDRRGAGITMQTFRRMTADCRLIVLSQLPLDKCPEQWQAAVRSDSRIEFRVGTFDPFPYQLGDVYVYPSRLDGIGLTLPEALSCGLPAITTDSAPMNEFVTHQVNGLLIPTMAYRARPDGYYWPESLCDEGSLAMGLRYYLDNPTMIAEHGANARRDAEKHLA